MEEWEIASTAVVPVLGSGGFGSGLANGTASEIGGIGKDDDGREKDVFRRDNSLHVRGYDSAYLCSLRFRYLDPSL